MSHTLKQIAEALGLEAVGASDILIDGVSEPATARPDQLAMALKPAFAATLPSGQARAAFLYEGADWKSYGLEAAILSARPRFAMAGLSALMDLGQGYDTGIHSTAQIDASAEIEPGCSVGAFTIIGARVKLGAGTVVGPQSFIGMDTDIGEGALIHCGVRIAARVHIGKRLIAHPNAVIGSDGFSFVTPEKSGVEQVRDSLGAEGSTGGQTWARIHSLGGVTLGDDVEVGACTTIDRGSVRDTRVGHGTKLDNLVHVGHNVVIGENCLLCAQTGIAGSTVIGNNVVLGGQTGVSDNISIGDNVVSGGGTKIFTKVPPGRVMMGSPAVKMEQHLDSYKGLRRLPRLFRDVAELKKTVSKLTGSG